MKQGDGSHASKTRDFYKVKWDEVTLFVDGAVKEKLIISVKATAIYYTPSHSHNNVVPVVKSNIQTYLGLK
jgi:hypothetical protein